MKLNFIKEIDREEMTTEELLMKLPSHIGRNKFNGFYISDGESIDIGWLYLHNDGKNWCYKNHIDINNLIPMGLANDATGKNIY